MSHHGSFPAVRTSNLTVVDLFAGAGGISEGFRQAGFSILAGVELDPDAAATFALNFPDAKTIVGDIRSSKTREQVLEVSQKAAVLVGGPPCQAFSQVRNHSRLIDDPRNTLYREFVRALADTLPLAFLLENVTGLDQMGVRERISTDLTLDGEYSVRAQVVDAADFGVPQTRKRLVFMGVHTSLGVAPPVIHGSFATECVALVRNERAGRAQYRVMVQEHISAIRVAEALADPENDRVVTAWDAISDLAGLQAGSRSDVVSYEELLPSLSAYQRAMRSGAGPMLTNVQVPRINPDTVLRLRNIPKGGNYRDLPQKLLNRYITGHKWGQSNGTGRLSRRHFYAYRRLHPGMWAWTLNTKGDSVYHYSKARSLSVREFARLQSFPDRFVFTTDPRPGLIEGRHDGGPAHSRYRQAGNAVPPLLAKHLAIALSSQLRAAVPQHLRVRTA